MLTYKIAFLHKRLTSHEIKYSTDELKLTYHLTHLEMCKQVSPFKSLC